MGGTVSSMCSCEKNNLYKTSYSEILKENPKEISHTNTNKSPNKNKNSLQFSKITQFLSPNKIEEIEEDINLLNTEKNTFPSNNALSNRSNAHNISIFFDVPLESIQIEDNNKSNINKDNKKLENMFGQMSIIEEKNDIDKNILYKNESKRSLQNIINSFNAFNIFNVESKLDNTNININNSSVNEERRDKNDLYREECLSKNELNDKNDKNNLNQNLDGFGKYIDENGNYYEGYFNNGELNGEGKIIKIKENNNDKSINSTKKIINKVTYMGSINNFKKEGFGKETCYEYIYEGNFHNDMKNGKGKINFVNNGDYYEGIFTNDKISGYGKYIWNNKHQYIGDFIDGEMNGKGKYIWPDGSEYDGEYVNNKREGKGKFNLSNGVIFEGIFHNGKPKGKGKMLYNGSSVNSEFKDGHLKVAKKELEKLK